jgi:Flp pilus assembly protein TadD
MAKAAQDIRVCPTCGSRNKLKWDFCARCGESLQGVPVGEPQSAVGSVGSDEPDHLPEAPAPVWPIFVVLVALGAGVWFYRSGFTVSPGAKPDPEAFAAPTLPPSPVPPGPEPKGAAAYAEARRLAAAGDLAAAIPLFERAIAEDPRNGGYRDGYGEALLKGGRADDAFLHFRAAADIAPREYLPVLGRRYAQAGRDVEAMRAFDAALQAGVEDNTVRKELGRLLYTHKEYDRAATVLREALEKSPTDAEVRFHLGWAVEKNGRLDEAERLYRELVADDPSRVAARLRLAEVLYNQGNSEGAVSLYKEGLTLSPNAPNLHRALGSTLERMGRNQEAAAEYREYARLNPQAEDAKVLATRADALEKRAAAGS